MMCDREAGSIPVIEFVEAVRARAQGVVVIGSRVNEGRIEIDSTVED